MVGVKEGSPRGYLVKSVGWVSGDYRVNTSWGGGCVMRWVSGILMDEGHFEARGACGSARSRYSLRGKNAVSIRIRSVMLRAHLS